MAFTGIFATEAECDSKAGENVDATGWTEANKNQWIAEAESYINIKTGTNWSDTYSGLNNDVKRILSEAASNLTAIYGLNYNPTSIGSNILYEDMLNVLWARFQLCMEVLTETGSIKFINSQT